jgi:hypothetical protein
VHPQRREEAAREAELAEKMAMKKKMLDLQSKSMDHMLLPHAHGHVRMHMLRSYLNCMLLLDSQESTAQPTRT